MQTETFIIGNREFTAKKMNAFDGGRFLLRLKGMIAPAFAELIQSQQTQEVNVLELLSGMDEEMHEQVIFPILSAASAYSIEDKRKIASAMDMNVCFTMDTLLDFYLLVWEVLKLNFAPFIEHATSHFGSLDIGK